MVGLPNAGKGSSRNNNNKGSSISKHIKNTNRGLKLELLVLPPPCNSRRQSTNPEKFSVLPSLHVACLFDCKTFKRIIVSRSCYYSFIEDMVYSKTHSCRVEGVVMPTNRRIKNDPTTNSVCPIHSTAPLPLLLCCRHRNYVAEYNAGATTEHTTKPVQVGWELKGCGRRLVFK